MYVIIGGSGRLGSCLSSAAKDAVHKVDNEIYSQWWRENSKIDILNYFEKKNITQATIIITAGILDPARPKLEHECVNYLLPKNIIEAVNILGMRTITFGTVLESLIGDKNQNPYISSKLKLANFVQESASRDVSALHIRLHTLYGGGQPPHKFMFLGQLLQAIQSKSSFKMTSGEQLREYHHIEDDAQAVFHLDNKKISGVTQLNHGKTYKLKDIASYVLDAFEHLSALQLNALTQPEYENYDSFFDSGSNIKGLVFRDTLPSVVDYLRPFVRELEN